MVIFKRKVSWSEWGLELKEDPGHAEKKGRGNGLFTGSKGLHAPGRNTRDEDGDQKDVSPAGAKRHRGLAARRGLIASDWVGPTCSSAQRKLAHP